MLLKFNNIRDLSDARYAAAMMAEWIGFEVGGAQDLSPAEIQEIAAWCAGPKLVLEVQPGTDTALVSSLVDVLKADAIECEAADQPALGDALQGRIQEWIVRGNGGPATCWHHSAELLDGQKTICRIQTGAVTAADIEASGATAISLDCFPAASTGIKDFGDWNDLFEELGLL